MDIYPVGINQLDHLGCVFISYYWSCNSLLDLESIELINLLRAHSCSRFTESMLQERHLHAISAVHIVSEGGIKTLPGKQDESVFIVL